jgi:MYXO-CTERM domain-containing protein
MLLLISTLSISMAANVFVIEDSDPDTNDLIEGLVDAGHTVERSGDWGFYEWEFTEGLYDFSSTDVVVWLDGNFAGGFSMPTSGQEALLDFVDGGGGVLSFGQNGTNYLNSKHPSLGALLPLRSWTTYVDGYYFCAEEDEPLCESVDSDGDGVSIDGGHVVVGSPDSGDSSLYFMPSWLAGFHPFDFAGTATYSSAVALDVGEGHAVQWALWGNSYGPGWQTPWWDETVAQMVDNSVRWLSQGAPRADAGGPYEVIAGDVLYLNASESAPRGDATIVDYTWGIDGYVWSSSSPLTTYDFTAAHDGPVTLDVGLLVRDSDGRESAAATTVFIDNADPYVVSIECPSSALEGESFYVEAEAADPEPADTVTIQWRLNGVDVATGSGVDIVVLDEGAVTIDAVITDDDGGSVVVACDPDPIVVENVPPTITVDPDTAIDAWASYLVIPSVTDPGSLDVHTWSVDGPDTLDIEHDTGVIHWMPTIAQVGGHSITLYVTDGTDTTSVTWDVEVRWPDVDLDGETADTDCNDSDALIFTGATEACDGIDNNCNGMVDEPGAEGSSLFYADADGDGWGDSAETEMLCAETSDFVSTDDDCDDDDPTIYPGAVEICDGIDSDCNGSLADGFADEDGDDRPDCIDLDSDGDGMSDEWEAFYGLDPTDPEDGSSDPDGDGRTSAEEFEWGTDPTEYHGPGVPEIFAPEDGAEAAQPLELVVTDADAPLGQLLTHAMDLATMSTLDPDSVIAGTDGLVGSDGRTGWLLEDELEENTWYYWTARASDGYVTGGSMSTGSFFLNTENDPPGIPGLNSPLDGVIVEDVTLVVDVPSDPDNDAVSIRFSLELEGTDVLESDLIAGEETTASWSPDALFEEGASLCWWAVAVDEEGLEGESSEESCFMITAINEPPSAPTIDTPFAYARLDTAQPEIRVVNGIDPDGDVTEHRFEVDLESTFDTDELQIGTVASGEDGTTVWAPEMPLPEDSWVLVRVQCTDGESDSEWATSTFFVSSENGAPSVPVLLDPSDGVAFAEDGTLKVTNSVDPEEQEVTYDFQVVDLRDAVIAEVDAVDEGDAHTAWSPGFLEDGTYLWTARAMDSDGESSAWAEPRSIVVGTPGLLEEPEVGGMVVDPKADGCSCTSARQSTRGWGWLLLLVGLIAQRRRSPRF